MSRKLTTALVFALVLTMALSVSVFAQGAGPADGATTCATFVDANGDGICDNWVDVDADGVNDSAPRDGSGTQFGRQDGQYRNQQAAAGLGSGAGVNGFGDFVDADLDGSCDNYIDEDGDGSNDSAPQDGTGNQHGRSAGRGAGK